jgi:hypothetical protein
MRQAPHKPWFVIVGEFAYKPNVWDEPMCHHSQGDSISYDNWERIPDFVQVRLKSLYIKYPECIVRLPGEHHG